MTDKKIPPEHKNVYAALAAAQAEMGKALKDAENPHFRSKYADLSSVVDAVRPALNAHGIAYFHIPGQGEFGHTMTTVLYHGASETSIEAVVPLILGKQDMQGYKSATTYAKRIGLESVTGIAPDEDDDGNAAVATVRDRAPVSASTSGSLIQAWKDAVEDSLPETATAAQKAIAYADKMLEEIPEKATPRSVDSKNDALENYMSARKGLMDWLGKHYPDKHAEVMDAYLARRNDLLEQKAREDGNLATAAE